MSAMLGRLPPNTSLVSSRPDYDDGVDSGAANEWARELGPMLPPEDLRTLLGEDGSERLGDLVAQRRLIGLRDGAGRLVVPAFQFRDGRVMPELVAAFWMVADT